MPIRFQGLDQNTGQGGPQSGQVSGAPILQGGAQSGQGSGVLDNNVPQGVGVPSDGSIRNSSLCSGSVQERHVKSGGLDAAIVLLDGSLSLDLYAESIQPVQVVSALPACGAGQTDEIAFLTTDKQLYQCDGAAWQVMTPDGSNIVANSITAGQIAVGAIGTDELAANSIVSSKVASNQIFARNLVVSSFDNLATNPNFESDTVGGAGDPHDYVVPSGSFAWITNTGQARSGTRCAEADINTGGTFGGGGMLININGDGAETAAAMASHVVASEGDEFYVQGWARYVTTNNAVAPIIRISFRDATGTELVGSGSSRWPTLTTAYQAHTHKLTAPANTVYVIMQVGFLAADSCTNGARVVFDTCYFRRVVDDPIIGTVTADKLTAGDITVSIDLAGSGILQSSNFVSATSGWQLLASGVGEYNDDFKIGGDLFLHGGGRIRTAAAPNTHWELLTSGASAIMRAKVGAGEAIEASIQYTGDVGGTLSISADGPANNADISIDAGDQLQLRIDAAIKAEVTSQGLGLPAGTVAAPSLHFGTGGTGDTNTGVMQPAADQVALVAGGVQLLTCLEGTTDYVTIGGTGLRLPDGAVGAPSLTAASDTDTGLYWLAAGQLAVTSDSSTVCYFDVPASDDARIHLGAESNDYVQYQNVTERFRWVIQNAVEMSLTATEFTVPNVYNLTTAAAADVNVSTTGLLRRSTSSERMKRNIRPLGPTGVLDCSPVQFQGMQAVGAGTAKAGDARHEIVDLPYEQVGLTAEDVAANFPLACIRNEAGDPENVDWRALVAALLSEVKRLSADVAALRP